MNVVSYNYYDDCILHLDDEGIWTGDLLYILFSFSCWMHALFQFSNLWRWISNFIRILCRLKELWYCTFCKAYPQTLGWCSHFLTDCSLSGENVENQLYLLVVCYEGHW